MHGRRVIYFAHDIMTIIRKIKIQHQLADINSIHKKIIKILDYHDVSKEFLNTRIENIWGDSIITSH